MIYDVDYFIKKFEALKSVGTGQLNNHCAYWYCGVRESYFNNTKEATALSNILSPLVPEKNSIMVFGTSLSWSVININDGHVEKYQQRSAKKRILAALYDAKKLQQQPIIPKPPITTNLDKMRVKYVSVRMETIETVTSN